jgi:hypothetical protein
MDIFPFLGSTVKGNLVIWCDRHILTGFGEMDRAISFDKFVVTGSD